MERKIAKDFEDWTEQTICQRANDIRDWALERWHIESADLPNEEVEVIEDSEIEIE